MDSGLLWWSPQAFVAYPVESHRAGVLSRWCLWPPFQPLPFIPLSSACPFLESCNTLYVAPVDCLQGTRDVPHVLSNELALVEADSAAGEPVVGMCVTANSQQCNSGFCWWVWVWVRGREQRRWECCWGTA